MVDAAPFVGVVVGDLPGDVGEQVAVALVGVVVGGDDFGDFGGTA